MRQANIGPEVGVGPLKLPKMKKRYGIEYRRTESCWSRKPFTIWYKTERARENAWSARNIYTSAWPDIERKKVEKIYGKEKE